MYHKGTRENVDCLDDIVLIQASNLENNNAIQHLKVRRISKEKAGRISCWFRRRVSSNISLNTNTMKRKTNFMMRLRKQRIQCYH